MSQQVSSQVGTYGKVVGLLGTTLGLVLTSSVIYQILSKICNAETTTTGNFILLLVLVLVGWLAFYIISATILIGNADSPASIANWLHLFWLTAIGPFVLAYWIFFGRFE